ncbi:hypothetical protein BRADI_1g30323v3 [Brachypodium distachyon]|uniref:Uncharacterized protein n=1 Tax=Brachypodium distachyon TaxID=15368 RepID=A0A0Q3H1A6_BRADI|nr:hypothetical protein BRADI_1g30323v3 [Brachypodium distachyon]
MPRATTRCRPPPCATASRERRGGKAEGHHGRRRRRRADGDRIHPILHDVAVHGVGVGGQPCLGGVEIVRRRRRGAWRTPRGRRPMEKPCHRRRGEQRSWWFRYRRNSLADARLHGGSLVSVASTGGAKPVVPISAQFLGGCETPWRLSGVRGEHGLHPCGSGGD